jgi:putative SOS response-associated peptidase YedK
MCGKFTQRPAWQEETDFVALLAPKPGPVEVETVTPMRFASVLMLEEGRRLACRMRWGWARRGDTAPGNVPHHIHARAETIDTLPTFADAFRTRRGLLMARTFNEGREVTAKKTEQHTITPRDGRPVGIAVLWECWQREGCGALYTFVMATTPPNALIGTITDRMPAVLPPEQWAKWLGEEPAHPAELKAMLMPFEGDWDMAPEYRPARKAAGQGSLF